MVFLKITLARESKDGSSTLPNWGLRLDTKGKQWISVAPIDDSIAGKAGIHAGDIIHSINGIAIFMRTLRQSGVSPGKQVNPMIDSFLRTQKTIVLDIERNDKSLGKGPEKRANESTQRENEKRAPAVPSTRNAQKNSPTNTKKPRLSHQQRAAATETPRMKERGSLAENGVTGTSARGTRRSNETSEHEERVSAAYAEKAIAKEKAIAQEKAIAEEKAIAREKAISEEKAVARGKNRVQAKDSHVQPSSLEQPPMNGRLESHSDTTLTGQTVASTTAPVAAGCTHIETKEVTVQLSERENGEDTTEVRWISSFGPFDAEELSLRRKLFAIAHSRHRQECRKTKENDKRVIENVFGRTASCNWYQYLRINSII
ncbi:carboxyl-terminal protease [Perkinsela sp. CCAP 1560/4]|nr:carboxyl-terminal protease [Perkinsela sp. CCAP 1560/4]|eukprot:KNH04273.1 carboxyl-terminal protease [Perkinsela sp. CCAP 1560/4]